MQRIVLLGLESIGNAGDEILAVTTEWLLKNTISDREDAEIKRKQLMPAYKDIIRLYWICVFAIPFKYLSRLLHGNAKYRIMNIMYKIKYMMYYKDCIKSADKIILPVGMLKYSTQDFSYIFDMITKISTMYNKPVLMSAMSIAKSDTSDWRFHQLVKAVNRPCVKCITSRDGEEGVFRLNEYYNITRNTVVDYVGDPALWIPECYDIKRRVKNTDVIGINIIRKGIYAAYCKEFFSDNQMLNLYKGIITELENRGYDWVLFCNGMQLDYEVGKQIIDELHLPKEKLLPPPKSGKELVEMIAGFKAIFGARLHACITAVSLGVPVSGLLWDDKLEFFSRTMKIRQYFSDVKELDSCMVVDKIESAIKHNLDIDNIAYYKQKTLLSIKNFVSLDYSL